MSDIEHAAQFVLQLMRGPVVAHATTRQAVVHQATTPHDLCTVTIILWILQDGKHGVFDAPQHGLCHIGGEIHVVILVK